MKMKKLTSKHMRFAELIASGSTIQEAGRKLGISIPTSYRWGSKPLIIEAIEDIRQGLFDKIQGRLLKAGQIASDTLISLCQDKEAPYHVRCTSAKAILDCLLKVKEHVEFEARLADIEDRLREQE